MLRSLIRSGLNRTYWLLDYSTAIFQPLCLQTPGMIHSSFELKLQISGPCLCCGCHSGNNSRSRRQDLASVDVDDDDNVNVGDQRRSVGAESVERSQPERIDETAEASKAGQLRRRYRGAPTFGIRIVAWFVTIAMIANFQRHFWVTEWFDSI